MSLQHFWKDKTERFVFLGSSLNAKSTFFNDFYDWYIVYMHMIMTVF